MMGAAVDDERRHRALRRERVERAEHRPRGRARARIAHATAAPSPSGRASSE
jgi:hypothetical protein